MPLPVQLPLAPMLAKAIDDIPVDAGGGLLYEPKWDGFRAIVAADGNEVEIGSRGSKPLTRYFPELVAAFRELLPEPCVLDGEIVLPLRSADGHRLDWDALGQRIHPAATRVAKLSVETPAMFVAFDLLARGERDLMGLPLTERRAELESLLAGVPSPISVTRATTEPATARRWLQEFEGAGLDGVVAKRLDGPYSPGKRVMFKVKHQRTADVVAIGYRVHKSGQGLGSLLVGLYDEAGELRSVGGISAFSDARRRELIAELDPFVERDDSGKPLLSETERSRFSSGRDVSFVRLRPELVVEVRYDQMEGDRFRHTVQFERWRPDREARSCTFEQLEQPITYDLARVLQ